MGTFEDRQKQYEEVDKPASYRTHVARGIRRKFANDFDMSDLSDQEVIDRHHARFATEMSPEEYAKKIDETYGTDYTPPEAPKETIPERVQGAASAVGKGAKDFATSLVPFLVPETPKVAGALAGGSVRAAAGAAAKSIPIASQVGFLGGHAINEAVDTATAKQLEQTSANIPVPKHDELTQQYFQKLSPGLTAKGYTPEQIMEEASHRAQNVVTGYQKTTQSLDEDVAQTQEQAAVQEPARAAADAFFLGVGAPAIEGALQKGLAKILGKAAPDLAAAAAKPTLGALARMGAHVRTGVVLGAPGMGIQGAIEAGVQAASENKTPHEIGQALVSGGVKGAKMGAVGGALLGGAAGALSEGVGAVARPFIEGSAKRQAEANARNLVEAKAKTNKILQTALDFNPHTAQVPLDGDAAQIATTIIQQAHGEEGALSEAGLRAASQIEHRIRLYQDANLSLEGNVNTAEMGPSQGRESGLQPVGAPLQQEGGLAPEPNPYNEPVTSTPPTPDATPQGLEGAVPSSTAAPRDLSLEGVQPESAAPAARLSNPPLGPVSNAAGMEHPAVEEPNPRDLTTPPAKPETPTPREKIRETNSAAQHVVEQYKQKNKFVDKEGRDMHPPLDKARAERIALEYHNLENAKPGTPEFEQARKSYQSLNVEIAKQFRAIREQGFKIEFVDTDPYKNSAEMRADVRDNHRLKVLKTPPGHHPFMTPRQNDIFRAVHDFFGHAAEGYEFGQRGEEAAFQQHAATLSNDAIPALASETRGQNSWVNSFPENAAKPVKERPFAEQKFALMPKHTYEDVLHPEASSSSTSPVEGVLKPSEPVAASSPVTPPAPTPAESPAAATAAVPVSAESAPPTEPQTASAAEPSSRAQEAVTTIGKLEHADVEATPEGNIKITRLSKVGKPGGTPGDLEAITQAADRHGVRVVTDLTPPPGIKGGRIPLEKVIPWYEARGFRPTVIERIAEGNISRAVMVREPIGEHQNAVAGALEKAAEEARARLAKKAGRLSVGFDPSMIGDAAIELAADAFSRRLRSGDEMASWLAEKWGADVKPFIDEIVAKAQKHFTRLFTSTGNAESKLNELLDLHASGNYGMGWYEKTSQWAKDRFGEDSDMFLRFLAVTSANGQTESGAAMALKAFSQWKMGMPFEGFRGQSMTGQLERATEGKDLGENTKIQQFLNALRGDPDAVVLDRWMMDAIGVKERGGSLRPQDYKMYARVVRDLAQMNDMTPRQFQAAVWEGARVRAIHMKEAVGGRQASTKTGSARPLEELVERKLGGMTPEEYAKASEGHLGMMQNLYQALEPVRNALKPIKGKVANGFELDPNAPSGHTFNPDTFEPAAHKGYVVTLVSNVTKRASLYPARILKFKEQIASFLPELKEKGLHPTIGIWQESIDGQPTGKFSVDLNVMIPKKDQALHLGKLSRQFALAKLGEGGEWQENIPTGYDPAVNGKQFLPPKEWTKQDAWHKQQINRARAFLANTMKKFPTPKE